jgi:hypothetical protein
MKAVDVKTINEQNRHHASFRRDRLKDILGYKNY